MLHCACSDVAECHEEDAKLKPVLVLLQGTALQRVTDVALGVAIPVHSHIAINSVLSDYVPKSVMGEGLPEHCQQHLPCRGLASGCSRQHDTC